MPDLPVLHLRAEQKPLEHRSFSPAVLADLVKAGYTVRVERSPDKDDPTRRRIFSDDEYEAVGATLVDTGSWPESSGRETIVLGLKELPPADGFPLTSDHIMFAHCYKAQAGWDKILSRWALGGAVLYDLEFLVDEEGRRISAFGYHAGFAGAALGVKAWAHGYLSIARAPWTRPPPLPSMASFTEGRGYYASEAELVDQIRADIKAGADANEGKKPTVLVMGALGRCGRGACDLLVKAGLPEANITRWDLAETRARHGPYEEIREHDIFINAIYLSDPIPPFVDRDMLAREGRLLSVIVDVSCDTTNPNNPIPVYKENSTFDSPTIPADVPMDQNDQPVQVVSIDHLPSILPREASEAFSNGLRESLLQLGSRDTARVWAGAKNLFDEKVALLPEELGGQGLANDKLEVEKPKQELKEEELKEDDSDLTDEELKEEEQGEEKL